MSGRIRPGRRRIERGIYEEPSGRYAVCVMVAAKPHFRTIDAETLREARDQRTLLKALGELGELPLSPSLTFGAVAARWLADFEAKVAIGTRSERTLDLYRSQLRLHLLPQLAAAESQRSRQTTSSQLRASCSRAVCRPGRSSGSLAGSAAYSATPSGVVTSTSIRSGAPSATSGRIRSAPTSACSHDRSSPGFSPPVGAAIGRSS